MYTVVHTLQIFIMNTENTQDLMLSEQYDFRHGYGCDGLDLVTMVTVPVTYPTNKVDTVNSLALQYTTYVLNQFRTNWTSVGLLL